MAAVLLIVLPAGTAGLPARIGNPVLRITLEDPPAMGPRALMSLNIWVRYGQANWTVVFNAGEAGAEGLKAAGATLQVMLPQVPTAVRFGFNACTGADLKVKALDILMPDGRSLKPSGAQGIGHVGNAAHLLNGRTPAPIIGHGCLEFTRKGATPDILEVSLPQEPSLAGVRPTAAPSSPLAPVRNPHFGLYHLATKDSDPKHSMPNWQYTPDPSALAAYDFLIPQSINNKLFEEIKGRNAKIRIIPRIIWPSTNPLDYFYSNAEREKIRTAVLKQLQLGTQLCHGVCIGDEEPTHFFQGWFAPNPPEWAIRNASRYRMETQREFNWGDPECRKWIVAKGRALWDDLYTIVKGHDPKLKFLPFLYVPGDISRWGLWDPETIKADGWIYQWHVQPLDMMNRDDWDGSTGAAPLFFKEAWFPGALRKLLRAGIPPEEIYCQVWAYRPADDPVAQAHSVLAAGLTNIFVFFNFAWLPPEPFSSCPNRDAAFRLWSPDSETAALAQESQTGFAAIGVGLAQQVTATAPTYSKVDLLLRAERAAPLVLSILPDAKGHPGGPPLAQCEFEIPAGFNGWWSQPLSFQVAPQSTFYVALTPLPNRVTDPKESFTLGHRLDSDPCGPVAWAITARNPPPGGALIRREVFPGWFDDWRTYGTGGGWVDAWKLSYELRKKWDAFMDKRE